MTRAELAKCCPWIAIAAVILAVSGCASQTYWIKFGSSNADLARDGYECERDTYQGNFGYDALAAAIARQRFLKLCMMAHGWTETTADGKAIH